MLSLKNAFSSARKVIMAYDLRISQSSEISFFGKWFFKVFGFDRRLSNQKTLKMFGPKKCYPRANVADNHMFDFEVGFWSAQKGVFVFGRRLSNPKTWKKLSKKMLSLKNAFSPARKVIMVFDLWISQSSVISSFGKCFLRFLDLTGACQIQKLFKIFSKKMLSLHTCDAFEP